MNNVKRSLLHAICAVLCFLILLVSCNFDDRPFDSDTSDNSESSITPSNSDTNDPEESFSDTEKVTDTDKETEEETKPTGAYGLGASSVYCFRGLPTNFPVQQIALLRENGKLYAYAVQRSGTTIYLSMALVDEKTGYADVRYCTELYGYGHGESFDLSVRDGSVYLYIASGANPANNYAWATTVTRLKFVDGIVSDEKTISGIEHATKSGDAVFSEATPYRINFALDNESDLFVLYVRADKNHTGKNIKHSLTAYRLSDIDRLLDMCSGEISLADCRSAFLATSGQKALEDICYNTSFQGMEVDNEGTIYVVGGNDSIQPELSRFKIEGENIKRKLVTKINWMESDYLNNRNFAIATIYVEIESIKYFEGKLYCSFYKSTLEVNRQTEIFELMEKN